MKSVCHGVNISRSSVGLILVKGRYERRGVCPYCMRFCEIKSSSKILSAAPQSYIKRIERIKDLLIEMIMLIVFIFFFLLSALTLVLHIIDHNSHTPGLESTYNQEEMEI